MDSYLIRCRACGSASLIKAGSSPSGKPRHICKDCNLESVNHIRSEDLEIVTQAVTLAKAMQKVYPISF